MKVSVRSGASVRPPPLVDWTEQAGLEDGLSLVV